MANEKQNGTKNKNKFQNRGKQNARKEDRHDVMRDRPGKNDISWYGDPKLIEAAGRVNFTNPLGKPIGWAFDNTGTLQLSLATPGAGDASGVPGVMSLCVEPGIGIAENATDPANVFMRNFYSWIRHANSGHTNYNAPDLGLYIMAVDQIHLILEHIVRIYGVARTYSSANRYMPEAILKAMGCDPNDATAPLYSNLATFRSELLNLMIKVGTFVVPKDFKIIERHRELFRYIYADGTTGKSQIYLFRPEGYKIYNETGSGHTGGYLEHHAIASNAPISFAAWLNIASNMIDALVQSEDMNIMSGDILKAYGAENCYKLEYFDSDYTVVPLYNPEILLQIHNAVIAGEAWDDASLDIYQDPNDNIIKYTPVFKVGNPYQNASPIVDMPVEVPTPDQVMIATRFVNMGSVGHESGLYKYVPNSIGSEVVTEINIYSFYNNSGSWTLDVIKYFGGMEASASFNMWRRAAAITNFNWHMPIKVLHKTDDTHWEIVSYIGECENYTPLYEGDIYKLHDVALIGEFKVPLMGIMEFGNTKT